MRFLYTYRTSDNVEHEGAISASSRDAAYAALRERGIRAGRVTEAPGFFNKLFGKGKRWLAIGALAVVIGVLAVLLRDAEEAVAETRFEPSEAYVSLQRDAEEIMEAATNDVNVAREKVKALFRERYPQLSEATREREEAQALYGRLTFRLDGLEALSRNRLP